MGLQTTKKLGMMGLEVRQTGKDILRFSVVCYCFLHLKRQSLKVTRLVKMLGYAFLTCHYIDISCHLCFKILSDLAKDFDCF